MSDRIVGEGETTKTYESSSYLILKFAKSYHVCVFLENRQIDFSDERKSADFFREIEQLKSQNNLNMLLFISDIDKKNIPLHIQSILMNKHNLFFEFIQKTDLQKIAIQGLEIHDEDIVNTKITIDQYRYAQLIFERLMSYLSIISNEIVFLPFLEKLHRELDLENSYTAKKMLNQILVSYSKRDNIKIFTDYSRDVLLKDICKYSYLARHTIYYERTLLYDTVDALLLKNEKLGLVVEICAPNSLITSSIIDKSKKILLFTASHNAYSLMSKLEEKTEHKFLPENVSLCLSHLNAEYMMHQYPDELNGKVDLLVIGYGSGSQINDLIRFLRYAYNWLSDKGVLFLSTYNSDAIVFSKQFVKDQRFESIPFNQTDYWTQVLDAQTLLLKKIKSYKLEHLISIVTGLFNTSKVSKSTYPYFSALINPDVYSREILDEIREADKLFAYQGTHGQFINIVVHKSELFHSSTKKIKDFLEKRQISFDSYPHTLAPDSKSLKQSLQIENVLMKNTILLKTVILQNKGQKFSDISEWIFVILPYDRRVSYNHSKYELVSESFILKQFNQGTISPLTVIVENNDGNIPDCRIVLFNKVKITSKYIIMGGGSNTESIRIKTKDFNNITSKFNIISENILE